MTGSLDHQNSDEVIPQSPPVGSQMVPSLAMDAAADIEEVISANSLEQRLHERREAGEISTDALPYSYINELFTEQMCPVMRGDLATPSVPQAVVLSRQQVDTLGCFVYVNANGSIEVINSEMMKADTLILFPEDFGDMGYEDSRDEFLEMFPAGLGLIISDY